MQRQAKKQPSYPLTFSELPQKKRRLEMFIYYVNHKYFKTKHCDKYIFLYVFNLKPPFGWDYFHEGLPWWLS